MTDDTRLLGPCTECGCPRNSCVVHTGWCCDDCLHFDADWDGYRTEPEDDDMPNPDDQQIRDRLRTAITDAWKRFVVDDDNEPGDTDWEDVVADALLPVVRDLIADALDAAADDISRPANGAAYEVWAYGGGGWLRDRATALRNQP